MLNVEFRLVKIVLSIIVIVKYYYHYSYYITHERYLQKSKLTNFNKYKIDIY
jgi:hypothetical protein